MTIPRCRYTGPKNALVPYNADGSEKSDQDKSNASAVLTQLIEQHSDSLAQHHYTSMLVRRLIVIRS
jgi:hypothetical protein